MADAPSDLKQIRRIEQREKKHRAILDAALERVSEVGLDKLTMPGLAKAMGLAVGGLYRFVSSKERLVVELQARAIDRLWRRLGHRWREVRDLPGEDAGVRALAVLVTSMEATLALEIHDPLQHALIARLWAQPPGESDAAWLVDRAQPFLEAILTRLHTAVEVGAIDAVDPLPTLAWFGASLFAAQALPEVVRPGPVTVVNGLLRGVGADPARLDEARAFLVE